MQQADRAHSATGTFASPGNPNNNIAFLASRRSMLTGTLGAIGSTIIAGAVVVAVPRAAMGAPETQSCTPFRIAVHRLDMATARFSGLPMELEAENPTVFEIEQDQFIDAVRAVERAPVADFREFVELFQLACDDGDSLPNDDTIMKLAIDARRLLGNAA